MRSPPVGRVQLRCRSLPCLAKGLASMIVEAPPSCPSTLQAACWAFGTDGFFWCKLGPLVKPGPTCECGGLQECAQPLEDFLPCQQCFEWRSRRKQALGVQASVLPAPGAPTVGATPVCRVEGWFSRESAVQGAPQAAAARGPGRRAWRWRERRPAARGLVGARAVRGSGGCRSGGCEEMEQRIGARCTGLSMAMPLC